MTPSPSFSNMSDRLYLDVLRYLAGMPPAKSPIQEVRDASGQYTYEAIKECNKAVEPALQLMSNRLIMGALRYGNIGDPCKKPYDRVASIMRRVKAYEATGNQEHLIDVANEAILEFTEPFCHHDPHFESVDDGEHTQPK